MVKLNYYIIFVAAFVATNVLGGGHHGHDHHGHGHGHEEEPEEVYKQASLYSLKRNVYTMSMCKPVDHVHGITFSAIQMAGDTVESGKNLAKEAFEGFNTPRVSLKNGDKITIGNRVKLYRVEIAEEDHHDHAHDHESHEKTDSHEGHNHRRMQDDVCSGHGHLHGSSCHCDKGYVNKDDSTCVVMPSMASCETMVVAMNVTRDMTLGIYADYVLSNLQMKMEDLEGNEVEMLACDGCAEEEELSTSASWGLTILACFTVTITSVLGLVALGCGRTLFATITEYMISFAAGSLLATVLYHVYPEAAEFVAGDDTWKLATAVTVGVLFGVFIEQGVHIFLASRGIKHTHNMHEACAEKEDDEEYVETTTPINGDELEKQSNTVLGRVQPIVYVTAVGDMVHGLTDGILIAIGFSSCNSSTGWLITIAIIFHEVPHRVADFFIFVRGGLSIPKAVILNFIASLSTVVGGVLLLSAGEIEQKIMGYLLGVGSGMLLFISMSQLLPALLHMVEIKSIMINLALFVAGVTVIGVTMMNHTHCDYDGTVHNH